ncbi:MAG: ABC transporter family substrate-binding protein [Ilumatobacteraceae bacterium]
MTTKRRGTRLAALAVGLALVAGACSSDDSSSDTTGGNTTQPTDTTAPPAEKVVTYAAEQEYTSYNNGTSDQGLFANSLVLNMTLPGPFLGLPDFTFEVWSEMMSAVNVVSTDPQVIEYVVKPEAVWSDGEPIDCDDFVLAWMSSNGKLEYPNPDYTGPGQVDADGNEVPEKLPAFNTASTTGYENVESVDCSDDGLTITSTYSEPYADWQGLFGGLLPAHIVEQNAGVEDLTAVSATEISDEAIALGEFWSTGFVGFDPAVALSGSYFVIDSWTPGQNLILKRNEAFYGTPAKLDSLVFLLVPDAAQQPAALENGDVQVITPQPNPDLVAQIAAIEGITYSVEQGLTFEHYDFNQANVHLANLEVRQALALCINRQEIVDTLIGPINPDATVLNSRIYVPAAADYVDGSGEFASQDIDAAKAKLESIGYTLGSDGVYVSPAGERLSLRTGRRDPNPRRQSNNELFAEQCLEAGIELTDDPAEDFNSTRLPASDYDIALFAWVSTPFLSSNTSIYIPGGGQNWNNYSNPKLQELFDQANIELDPAKRADLMNEIDAILWADMATLPLFQFQELVAASTSVTGVVFHGPAGITWNANEWDIAG